MKCTRTERVYLSPPHLGTEERNFVAEAFATNWIAPLGPNVDTFETEFSQYIGCSHAVALNSGTAALHLALKLVGVGPGDTVLGSTLTFVASANPVVYLGAIPAFVDSERTSWNMDPELLEADLDRRSQAGSLPMAVVVVHIFGQTADMDPIVSTCAQYGIPLVEDAAEALGALHNGRQAGSFGRFGIFSFNGNKIITTSGGGMLVTDDPDLAVHARKLATQAREVAPHYEHREVGYNYRLSNILAGIGRGQLQVLDERIATRRSNFEYYVSVLGDLPGLEFMPEAPWGRHTRWLTTLTIDPVEFGVDREVVRLALEAQNIEARPIWKPMHLQPLFEGCERAGGQVAEDLFKRGLCLPSGSNLTEADLERVTSVLRQACPAAR